MHIVPCSGRGYVDEPALRGLPAVVAPSNVEGAEWEGNAVDGNPDGRRGSRAAPRARSRRRQKSTTSFARP